MTKKELIKELESTKENGGGGSYHSGWNDCISHTINMIKLQLEPTISEIKEYCNKFGVHCGCNIPIVDEVCHMEQSPNKWDIEEITKSLIRR